MSYPKTASIVPPVMSETSFTVVINRPGKGDGEAIMGFASQADLVKYVDGLDDEIRVVDCYRQQTIVLTEGIDLSLFGFEVGS